MLDCVIALKAKITRDQLVLVCTSYFREQGSQVPLCFDWK